MVPNPEMITLGLDVRIHDLVVEELRRLRIARNPPVVIIEEPAKEPELSLLVENLDLHEVGELPNKGMDLLIKLRDLVLDLAAEQHLHGVVGELGLQLSECSGRITEELGERRANTRLGSWPFEHDGIEDFDMVEMVTFRVEELSPLVYRCLDNGIVVAGKGNLRTI
ncbi:MAG: hypothetical protein ACRD3N_00505 [Terracidiphilus sp.]